MISTVIRGGLGNQMFIYAMARAMAIRNHTDAVFNLEYGFKHDIQFKRQLELTCLNVQLKENKRFTFDIPFGRIAMRTSCIVGRNVIAPSYKYIIEKAPLHFQQELVVKPYNKVFLEGYWQSEKYFSDCVPQIKKDFEITMPIDESVKEEERLINEGDYNTVLLGIRRYQECATLKDGVVLDDDYYNKAIRLMESKVPNTKFIIFTQQQEWARQHIRTERPTYFVSPKVGAFNSVKDLYLMKQCRHAIISNSSFYWWGAWLSNNSDGVVIAPNNFLNRDTVCHRWINI